MFSVAPFSDYAFPMGPGTIGPTIVAVMSVVQTVLLLAPMFIAGLTERANARRLMHTKLPATSTSSARQPITQAQAPTHRRTERPEEADKKKRAA